jgi:phage I-like protein
MLSRTYKNYAKLERRVSLDVNHSVSDSALDLTKRVSIGTCKLELRSNQLWAVDVVFNKKEYEDLASTGQFGIYISQEFYGLDANGNPTSDLALARSFDLERITLTDNPATIGAKPIIRLSRNNYNFKKDIVMDDKLLQALQTLLASLPTIINGLGDQAGVDPNVAPGQDTDGDAVNGVDIDGDKDNAPAEEAVKEEEVPAEKLEDEAPAEEAVPVDEEKVEKEAQPEEKKKELSRDDECILQFVREKLGSSLNEIQATLLSLNVEIDGKKELESEKVLLQKKVADLQSEKDALSAKVEEEMKKSNLELAFSSGKLSPKAGSSVKAFTEMPLESQKLFLTRKISLFESLTEADVKPEEPKNEINCIPERYKSLFSK